jgi:hypothetical protein
VIPETNLLAAEAMAGREKTLNDTQAKEVRQVQTWIA